MQALLEASGLGPAAAETVAVSLVHANRRGTDSHGVARVLVYVAAAARRPHEPRPRAEGRARGRRGRPRRRRPGPGSVAGVFATDLSIDLAREHGVGLVAVHRSSHYGAAGYYAIRAAEAGMVGMSTTNSEPFVVPYGGIGHALGTNPIALAAPTPGRDLGHRHGDQPGRGQQDLQRPRRGPHDPRGLGRRREGAPTTDPGEVYAAVPLGGYKGYALALLVEVLSGVLSGSGVGHGIGRPLRGRAPAGRRALPPRHRRRAAGGPRARRRAAQPAARRPQGDPARARLRRGAGARRARAARPRPARSARASRSRPRSGRRSTSSARSLA